MRTVRSKTPLLLALALLTAACASSNRFQADVTRFHLNQPIARSTVQLQPGDPALAGTLEYRTHEAAVAEALRAEGFQPVSNLSQAELVGVIRYQQTTRAGLARRAPVTIGVGGGSFGGNIGIGVGTSFGIGKGKSNDMKINLLELQLKRRSDNSVIWEGRAVSEAREGSPHAALGTAMPELARALLSGFPGQSGKTIRYPSNRRGS